MSDFETEIVLPPSPRPVVIEPTEKPFSAVRVIKYVAGTAPLGQEEQGVVESEYVIPVKELRRQPEPKQDEDEVPTLKRKAPRGHAPEWSRARRTVPLPYAPQKRDPWALNSYA